MLMGMVQQSSQDKPETAAFMRNLNFGVEENVVKVGFTVPAAELEKAVQSAVNARMKNAPVTVSATVTPIPPAAPPAARVARANSVAARPGDPVVTGPTIRSARIPANAEILVQSSPKDMGTVVIYAPAK